MGDSNASAKDIRASRLLEPSGEREATFLRHPIVTDKAKIPTPQVKEAYSVVESAIVHYEPSVTFVADSRFGKTYGLEVVRQTLPQSFPHLATFSILAKEHDHQTERALYTDLLVDCGHGLADSGTAVARRLRLLSRWITTVQASHQDRLVLFVDEAQNWGEDDYTRLRDLTNDLAANDIRTITVLFAHPNLLVTRTALMRHGRTDLIGRFMLRPMGFRGVSCVDELREIACSYDNATISEFPAGSGISYSEFFMPDEYREGWRLEQEMAECWAAFSAVSEKHGGRYQIGMKWIASAIRDFFYSRWQGQHGAPLETEDLWATAVEASGFEYSLGVLQDRQH